MLYTVGDREFTALVKDKEDIVNARTGYAAPLMAAIASKWIAVLPPSATLILIWLMGRTLAFGKAADRISQKEFITDLSQDGDEVHFAPLPLSTNSIRKHLKTLCDIDFINVFSVVAASSGAESQPRMYEINCKMLLDTTELEGRNVAFLGDIEGEVAQETSQKRASKRTRNGVPPTNGWEGCTYNIHTVGKPTSSPIYGLDKSNLLPPVSDAADLAGGSSTQGDNLYNLPTPKKIRTAVTRPDSIREVLATAVGSSTARRADRAAATNFEINLKNVQACLDVSMKKYHPDLPRTMVTAKTLGVFKKRIVAAQIKDVAAFIDYIIMHWSMLAAQNRKAFVKDPTKASQGQPLPPAPSFMVIAYKLPYFIAVFSNNLMTGPGGKTSSPEAEEIARLRREVASLKEAKLAGEGIIRRMRTRPEPPPPPRQPAGKVENLIREEWAPPTWNEVVKSRERKRG